MARPAGIPLFPPGGRDHREKFRYRMQVGNGPVEDFDCQRRNPMTFIPSAHSSDAPVVHTGRHNSGVREPEGSPSSLPAGSVVGRHYGALALDNPSTLRRGDRGDEVDRLQEALLDASAPGAMYAPCTSERKGLFTSNECAWTPGTFDEDTEDSVKAFQSAKGLGVDGIVGKNTWKALGVTDQKTTIQSIVEAVTPSVQAAAASSGGEPAKEEQVKVWDQPWFLPVAVGTGAVVLGTVLIAIMGKK